jgi:hypothetical protein
MIWKKAWWECRFRVLLSAVLMTSVFVIGWLGHTLPIYGPALAFVISLVVVNLAGSGVNSQSQWGMFSGFHPSMYFLLSLPISRRRALLTRTGVGAGLTFLFIVLGGASFSVFSPAVHAGTKLAAAGSAIVFLSITSFGLFGIATLLATMFDEVVAGVVSLGLAGALLGAATAIGAADKKLDPLAFVDGELFLKTGRIEWPAIAVFLIVGTACLIGSVVVVERKEY